MYIIHTVSVSLQKKGLRTPAYYYSLYSNVMASQPNVYCECTIKAVDKKCI